MISLSITTGPNFLGFRTLVWNWKTGQLVFVCLVCSFVSCLNFAWDSLTIMDGYQAFAMLNRETFMLTSTHLSGSLKIYAISHGKRIPLFLRVSNSQNCSRNIILELLIPIQVQSMLVLLKIDSSPPSRIQVISVSYIGPVPEDIVVTLSSSTTISSLVLLNRILLDRTYCGIHGVLNILDSYLVVFLQTGCGKFSFFN